MQIQNLINQPNLEPIIAYFNNNNFKFNNDLEKIGIATLIQDYINNNVIYDDSIFNRSCEFFNIIQQNNKKLLLDYLIVNTSKIYKIDFLEEISDILLDIYKNEKDNVVFPILNANPIDPIDPYEAIESTNIESNYDADSYNDPY